MALERTGIIRVTLQQQDRSLVSRRPSSVVCFCRSFIMTENDVESISEIQQDDEPKEPKPVVSENDLPPSSKSLLSTEGKEVQEDLLRINNDMSSADDDEKYTLICDMGYGLPREQKPRKEKLLAISRQIVNFIQWQMESLTGNCNDNDNDRIHRHRHSPASIQVVGCPDEETKLALQDRIQQNLASGLGDSSATTASNNTRGIIPSHVTISCDTIEDICTTSWNHISSQDIVYLSPDASEKLKGRPPKIAIVGLLIDRRIQPNRSKNRATNLQITAKRWPIDDFFADINPNEPLNVDCVMEGMQQWWWNVQQQKQLHQPNNEVAVEEEAFYLKAFIKAASQAIQHHVERHPSRPVHLPPK